MLINYSWPLVVALKVRSDAGTSARAPTAILGGSLSANSQLWTFIPKTKVSLLRKCLVVCVLKKKKKDGSIKGQISHVIK